MGTRDDLQILNFLSNHLDGCNFDELLSNTKLQSDEHKIALLQLDEEGKIKRYKRISLTGNMETVFKRIG